MNDNTVDVKLSLLPEMAILFFRFMTLKDDGDFWKELADACVAHSSYLDQTGVERYERAIYQLENVGKIVSLMEGVSS